ncbi:MAG: mechanosensitive ion channel family protein, partial [Candidatus Eisenbacteria bacterium]|nr:mechanosensitive ion channel family protein [Candidatus Eisenbacteria bacterium]
MNQLSEWVASATGFSPDVSVNLISTVVIVVVLWAARALVLRIVWRRSDDMKARYQWGKVSGYATVTTGALIIGRIWFAGFQSFATLAGLITAGIAIALKDLVANIAGWIFILWRRPFVVGDRVQIGEFAGDVIDIRVFQFSLLEVGNWVDADQSTGRVLHVPNGMLMTAPLASYSGGFQFIWNEIPILLTFESDWRKAKEILLKIGSEHAEHLSAKAAERVREASKKFMIFYSTLTPTVYTTVKNSGVLLTIRYLCRPRRRRSTEQAIWEDVLEQFAAVPGIDFAY